MEISRPTILLKLYLKLKLLERKDDLAYLLDQLMCIEFENTSNYFCYPHD